MTIRKQDILKSAEKNKRQALRKQLFSPATGLAILGTVAFVFCFYRAGQIAGVVHHKKAEPAKQIAPVQRVEEKIEIDPRSVIELYANSQAVALANQHKYKDAINQALKDLSENSPDSVSNIFTAGDIISHYGEDKELGFALLNRAISLAPDNQFIVMRYCLRLLDNGQTAKAEKELLELCKKYPQWSDPHIVLAKLHAENGKATAAVNELIEITNISTLDSKQNEEIALMLAKLGHPGDAFSIFQKATRGDRHKSFYTAYCNDLNAKTEPGSYEENLAAVQKSISQFKGGREQLIALEIKQASLLLTLGRYSEAEVALDKAIKANPENFDLNVLQAATYILLGHNAKAEISFQTAVASYNFGIK